MEATKKLVVLIYPSLNIQRSSGVSKAGFPDAKLPARSIIIHYLWIDSVIFYVVGWSQ